MTADAAILQARFDPRLKDFWFITTAAGMGFSIVGIPFIPLWLWGWGPWYCRESFERLKCILTPRTLIVRSGIFFRVEKTIPLDKIQDLTVRQGPLLRHFGLSLLQVETAGRSISDAILPGILGVAEFRQAVLEQRDALAAAGKGGSAPTSPEPKPPAGEEILLEIRDHLRRIEGHLAGGEDSGGEPAPAPCPPFDIPPGEGLRDGPTDAPHFRAETGGEAHPGVALEESRRAIRESGP